MPARSWVQEGMEEREKDKNTAAVKKIRTFKTCFGEKLVAFFRDCANYVSSCFSQSEHCRGSPGIVAGLSWECVAR